MIRHDAFHVTLCISLYTFMYLCCMLSCILLYTFMLCCVFCCILFLSRWLWLGLRFDCQVRSMSKIWACTSRSILRWMWFIDCSCVYLYVQLASSFLDSHVMVCKSKVLIHRMWWENPFTSKWNWPFREFLLTSYLVVASTTSYPAQIRASHYNMEVRKKSLYERKFLHLGLSLIVLWVNKTKLTFTFTVDTSIGVRLSLQL